MSWSRDSKSQLVRSDDNKVLEGFNVQLHSTAYVTDLSMALHRVELYRTITSTFKRISLPHVL